MNLLRNPNAIARLVGAARQRVAAFAVQPRPQQGGPLAISLPLDFDFPVMNEIIQVTTFRVEAVGTRDAVPLNVVATLFWCHHDPQHVAPARDAPPAPVMKVAQAALRELIGGSGLASLLADRQAAEAILREGIAQKTADWGLAARRVVIRRIGIPAAVQAAADARHLQALAECLVQRRRVAGGASAGRADGAAAAAG